MHLGARFYDSRLGRFASSDTIVPGLANPQSLDRYAYSYSSPLTYADPSGHSPACTDCDAGTDQEYVDAINRLAGADPDHPIIDASQGWERIELEALFQALSEFPFRDQIVGYLTKIVRGGQSDWVSAAYDTVDMDLTLMRMKAANLADLKKAVGIRDQLTYLKTAIGHELVHAWQRATVNESEYMAKVSEYLRGEGGLGSRKPTAEDIEEAIRSGAVPMMPCSQAIKTAKTSMLNPDGTPYSQAQFDAMIPGAGKGGWVTGQGREYEEAMAIGLSISIYAPNAWARGPAANPLRDWSYSMLR